MAGWALITRIDDWLHAHKTLVAAIAVIGMVLSWAQYAKFITLPEFLQLPAAFAWIIPALRYGVWEATAGRMLRQRRARLEGKTND